MHKYSFYISRPIPVHRVCESIPRVSRPIVTCSVWLARLPVSLPEVNLAVHVIETT